MKKITADVAAIPLKWSTKLQPPTMLVAILRGTTLDRGNFYSDDGAKRGVRLCYEAEDRREGDPRGVHVPGMVPIPGTSQHVEPEVRDFLLRGEQVGM